METRRENRPVFMTVARGLLTLDMRLSVARAAKPCARDPPRRAARYNAPQHGLRAGVPRQTLQGRPPHTRGHTAERGDAATSPLPNAGLAKLVPVTASYVTSEIHPLPTPPPYLAGSDYRNRSAGGIPRSRVLRRSSSTVTPSGDTHASPT
jgi:hypothetical protein